ncbi:MAG: proteasome assembly chaperone 4 family protein [Candidatus Bathyarchaeia archaeon]
MSYPKIVNEEIEEDGQRFTATLMEVENAIIVLFNEKERMRLGTLAVATPSPRGGLPSASSVLLGERNMVVTQVLAQRFAAHYRRISLVSTHVREAVEVGPILMRLAQRLIERSEGE